MRIIKHGSVIRCLCPLCGCDFMASEDECYKDHEKEQKGEVKWLSVCPDCGEIDVPGEKQTYETLEREEKAEEQEKTEIPFPMK